MSEIFNPDHQSQNGSSQTRAMLAGIIAFTILALALLFASHYLHQHPPTAAIASQSVAATPSPQAKTQFGWLAFLARPLYLALHFLHHHGVSNWGWAIILFTAIFNSVMIWPRLMAMKSSLKMMRLQPQINDLKKRYAHLKITDPKRAGINTEMMALYKAEGANLYNGCLPLLLQTPLLFAYASVLRNAQELHHAHWFWIPDLASPDPWHILPLVIILSMFLTQYITPAPGIDPTQRRIMAILIPVVMGFTLWHYASGLALYWATGNLINLIVQLIINRSKLGQEMQAITANRRV